MTLYYPDHKAEFSQALPKFGALLGLDVGTKKIGVAISDRARLVANPAALVMRDKFAHVVKKISVLLQNYEAVGLVVGYPFEMNGEAGVACQRVRHFCHNLVKALETRDLTCNLLLWDERLSSQAAEQAMLAADLSRANRAQRIDKVAASLILQGFLDYSHYETTA